MRRTKLTRTLSLVIALVLSICAFTGTVMTSSAEDYAALDVNSDLKVPTSIYTNVEYGGYLHLAVQIIYPENQVAGDYEYGIFVFDTSVEPADFATTEPIYSTFTVKTSIPEVGDPVKYCTTQGIAAKDISKEYRIALVVHDKVNDTYNFGTEVADENGGEASVFDYSVASYCEDRQNDQNVTEAQRNLYQKILAYGDAAIAVLGAK